jgi:non-specific serine/threonine protein kinase
MVKLKIDKIREKLAKIGLNTDGVSVFMDFVHDKYWDSAIKLYKNLEIIRKGLDSKDMAYLLIKQDKKSYDVNLELVDGKLDYFCNCPHLEDSKGCDHAGAILLYKLLKDEENDFKELKLSEEEIRDVEEVHIGLGYFRDLFPRKILADKVNMIYFNFEDFERDNQLLKINKGAIKKNGSYGTPVKFYGRDFATEKWDISKKVRKALSFVGEGDNYGMGSSSVGFSKSNFYDVNTDLVMPVLRDLYFEEPEVVLGVSFSREDFKIIWDVKKLKDKYIVEPFFYNGKTRKSLLNMNLLEIGNTSLWVFDCDSRCFYGHKMNDSLDIAKSIIRFPKRLELSENDLKEFFVRYYQQLLDGFKVNISSDLKRKEKFVQPITKIYLEKSGSGVKIKLRFDYASREIDYFSSNKELIIVENDIIYDISRDFEEEDRIVEFLNEYGVVTHEELDEFVIEGDLIDFVTDSIPEFVKRGIQVMGEEKLFNFKVVKSRPKMDLDVKESNDWFNIKGDVRFGHDEVDIEKILKAIFENKRFVELSDGKRGVIPKDWINSLKSFAGFVDFSSADVSLSRHHVSVINAIMGISNSVSMDEGVRNVIDAFKDFDGVKNVDLPRGLNAELRPYQKAGYDWLYFLRSFGFNGILADDMGLGKTLQALTLLQKIKEEGVKRPFLVVVPTSLVFNWKSEIDKFTGGMKVYMHHGLKRVSLKKKFEKVLNENDIVITTYGVLRNDLELFSESEFEYIVLDEAHMIKNPMSISAKAVYTLKGKSKLVISGTPIQNNLTELWSLFHFLNPGYLGGFDFFRDHFVGPIEKVHDENLVRSLKSMIDPFLLRRTKKIISDELPEKTEVVLTCEFSEDEKEIYDNWKEYYRNEIKTSIKENGLGKSKMKILEGLMRLRQICLHPRLIDSKYQGRSSKFELLMMEVEKVMGEGHKVLIFSSFVKMLSIVKEEFDKRGLKYSYLDGSTKNREAIVSEFQESEDSRAFLISIKAGGVGLNLTSADYVFILDPWWNPAVESQAMDRAHRIGQEKKVFAYKMITEDTIEEKILKLQAGKRELVENLISEEEGLLKTINIKEIEKIFG